MPELKLPQPTEACIIDLDGTLVDTLGDFEAALNGMLAALGRAPVTGAQIEPLVGKGSEHLIKSVLALDQQAPTAIENEANAVLQAAAWEHYQAAYQGINGRHSRVYAGVTEGLRALAALGLPLACLTNKPLAFARALLAAKGLDGFFCHVFGGDSFVRKKPDPLPLIETCRVLGTSPERTLMIGDSSNDAAAARAAGCPVVLMPYGYNHGQPITAVAADAHLPDMTAVARWLQARGHNAAQES